MTYKTRFQYLFDRAKDIAHSPALLNPAPALPPLFFFTDPARVSHPEDIAAHLPMGCGVVYRHFGEGHALQRARLLRKIAGDHGLVLLIGEDEALATEVEAHGVHLRQSSLARATEIRTAQPQWLITGACHDAEVLKGVDAGVMDAVFVSPLFASRSPSAQGAEPVGVRGIATFVEQARVPVYGLGGITCDNIADLRDSGLSGVGAVEAFSLVD